MPFDYRLDYRLSSLPPRHGFFGMVRNHPLLFAASAASGGVLLGAYVAVQLLITPVKQDDAGPPAQVAAAPAKAAPARAETTGSAPREERAAAIDCKRQTWPYLSNNCVQPGPRVVSTDRLDKPTVQAIEAPATRSVASEPAQPRSLTSAPVAAPSVTATAAATAVATPTEPALAQPKQAELAPPEAVKTPKTRHQHAQKSRHKAKAEEARARTDVDDEDAAASDEDAPAVRVSDDRRHHGRWSRHDYNVPSDEGYGNRRVTVYRRNNGSFGGAGSGGLFGGLFGFDN